MNFEYFIGGLLLLLVVSFFLYEFLGLIRALCAHIREKKSKKGVEKNADVNCNDTNGDTIVDN